jgi:hypothetical protein
MFETQSIFMVFMECLIVGLAIVLIPMAINTFRTLREKE